MADKPTQLSGWPRGVNQRSAETELPNGSLRKAKNVMLDRDGKPRRRRGFTKKLAADEMHSLWSGYGLTVCVTAGTLVRVNTDTWEIVVIRENVGTRPMSYDVVNDTLFYTNKAVSGRFNLISGVHSPNWGPRDPGGQPTLSATAGGLLPGKYMVAITFVDALGAESGTGTAATIELTERGGIQVDNIPDDSQINYVRVYCTDTNGRELYRALQFLAPGAPPSATITQPPSGRQLHTMHLSRMPHGDIVRGYKGRLFVARGNQLMYSDAMNYNLYAEDYNYLPAFVEDITMVEPVEDGLYVSADKLYFFRGTSPDDMTVSILSDKPAIARSSMTVDGNLVSNDLPTRVAYWFSEDGPTLGLPGGQVRQLATDTFEGIKQAASAASIVLRDEGVDRVLTALADSAPRSTFGARDVATIEVIKSTSQ